MIKYQKIPLSVDMNSLRDEVLRLLDCNWVEHYQTGHYDGDWRALAFRSVDGKSDNIFVAPQDDVAYQNTDVLKSSPVFTELLSTFQCPLRGVRLLKLAAGAKIKPHQDAGLKFENGEVRFHIPIITNDKVKFILDGEHVIMDAGTCWYLNFDLLHEVENNSDQDRIHLVIDADVNDWMRALFSEPTTDKKEIEEPGYDAETQKHIIAELRVLNTKTSNAMADEMEKVLLSD